MNARTYLFLSLLLTAVDCVGLTLWQIATADFVIMPGVLLGVRLVLDCAFVVANAPRLRVRSIELAMLSWILVSVLIGAWHMYWNAPGFFASRALKDTIPAALFFLKIAAFRQILRSEAIDRRMLVAVTLLISVVNVLAFYAFGGADELYVGLTPPVNPIVGGAVTYSSVSLMLLVLAVIYFSGKRALLASVLLYVACLFVIRPGKGRAVSGGFLVRLIGGLALAVTLSFLISSPIVDKLTQSAETVVDSDMASLGVESLWDLRRGGDELERVLYLATAGRSAEVFRILEGMSGADWLIGHGAGFTYSLELLDGTVIGDYANAHFSPLGLTYKYGITFALVFYFWLMTIALPRHSDGGNTTFWRCIVFLTALQSLFAFNLFVEFMLPLAVAALQVGSGRLQGDLDDARGHRAVSVVTRCDAFTAGQTSR